MRITNEGDVLVIEWSSDSAVYEMLPEQALGNSY
jgi:hypothetical protein